MIVCYGEILLDTFVNKATGKVASFVGGAPFNVAYQAKKIGNQVLFVGNIGKDEAGKTILKFFSDNDLDTSGLHILKDKKTTISSVELDQGERSFTFQREDKTDAFFLDDSLDLISQGDVIHVGSLMLSVIEGRDFLRQILSYGKSQKKILSFDINYREDIFKNEEEAIKIYEEVYPQFDIVKFSKEELTLFTKIDDPYKAVEKLKKGPKLILVTLGKDGSFAYCNNRIIKAKSIKVKAVDTTGAGDAFLGAFLSNVDSLGLHEMMFIPSLMESNLKFSNIAGALATTKKGALESIPSSKEISSMLEKQTFQN